MASIRLRSLLRCRRRSQQAMLLLLSLLLLAVSGAQSTRLPLEVYELTPSSDQTAAKHKSLEYTIYDAKELTGAAAAAAAGATTAAATAAAAAAAGTTTSEKPLTVAVVSISAEQQHETETDTETESEPVGRRARQMLLQQQQHRLGGSSNRHSKDLRILYQVGVSLLLINKICAANYTHTRTREQQLLRCNVCKQLDCIMQQHQQQRHLLNNFVTGCSAHASNRSIDRQQQQQPTAATLATAAAAAAGLPSLGLGLFLYLAAALC